MSSYPFIKIEKSWDQLWLEVTGKTLEQSAAEMEKYQRSWKLKNQKKFKASVALIKKKA